MGRLRDKSSNVRKNAVQLLSAFLTSNPFAGKVGEREEESMEESEERGGISWLMDGSLDLVQLLSVFLTSNCFSGKVVR